MLYVQEARKFEGEGHFKDAEKMYLSANEPDLAINMYKKAKQYDNMLRLVTKFRKDLSNKTGNQMDDIVSTLQYMGLIKYWKGKHVFIKNEASDT